MMFFVFLLISVVVCSTSSDMEGSGLGQYEPACDETPLSNFLLQDDVEIQVNISRNANWNQCTIVIVTPLATNFDGISVEIIHTNWAPSDYFYVEIPHNQDKCKNNILAVHNVERSCAIRIRTSNMMQIHTRSSTLVKFSMLPSDQWTSCDSLDDKDMQAASLCKSVVYDQIYHVEFHLQATVEGRLPTNPTDCEASLHYQRFTIQCSNQPHNNTLLIYPNLQPGTTIAKFPKFSKLFAGNRQITHISPGAFKDLDYLRFLDLDRNNLTAIQRDTFNGLDNLISLNLAKNHISQITEDTFSGLRKLSTVIIDGNEISFIDPRAFNQLRLLSLLEMNDNYLESIDPALFTRLENLHELSMTNNKMQVLKPRTFQFLGKLITLYLSHNELNSLEVELFYGLTKLNHLYMEGNSIANIPSDVFNDIPNVIILNLNKNQISNDFLFIDNLPHLLDLLLTYNRVTSLQVGMFPNFPKLEFLSLNHNSITYITPGTFRHLSALSELYLQNNLLQNLSPGAFKGLSQLKTLHLGSNKLIELQSGVFLGLVMLEELNLTDTSLTALQVGTFLGLPQLQWLHLNNNNLAKIEACVFAGLSKVSYLFLSSSQIEEISSGAFYGLKSLIDLELKNNKIKQLSMGVFQATGNSTQCLSTSNKTIRNGLTDIQNIYLQNNQISRIECKAFAGLSQLKNVQLEGNSLSFVSQCSFEGLPETSTITVESLSTCCFINDSQCKPVKSASPYLTCHHLLQNQIITIFMFVAGSCTIIGNIFVITWQCLRQNSNNAVQVLLITNLALSNLIMGFYILIIASVDSYFGPHFPSIAEEWRTGPACKFAGFLALFSSEASLFLITIISVDRLVVIVYPYSQFSKRSIVICLIMVWVIALSLGIIPIILSSTNPELYDMSEICMDLPLIPKALPEMEYMETSTYYYDTSSSSQSDSMYAYLDYVDDQSIYESDEMTQIYHTTESTTHPNHYLSLAIFLGLNSLCCLIIILSYIMIFVNLKKKSFQVPGYLSQSFRDRRLALKISAIVWTDFGCWMVIILLSILVQCHLISITPLLYTWIVAVVLPINSAINPILYTILSVCGRKKEPKSERINPLMMKNMLQD